MIVGIVLVGYNTVILPLIDGIVYIIKAIIAAIAIITFGRVSSPNWAVPGPVANPPGILRDGLLLLQQCAEQRSFGAELGIVPRWIASPAVCPTLHYLYPVKWLYNTLCPFLCWLSWDPTPGEHSCATPPYAIACFFIDIGWLLLGLATIMAVGMFLVAYWKAVRMLVHAVLSIAIVLPLHLLLALVHAAQGRIRYKHVLRITMASLQLHALSSAMTSS